eukprot:scaffold306719_cov33-Tisochrysis_lutea.AAC.4
MQEGTNDGEGHCLRGKPTDPPWRTPNASARESSSFSSPKSGSEATIASADETQPSRSISSLISSTSGSLSEAAAGSFKSSRSSDWERAREGSHWAAAVPVSSASGEPSRPFPLLARGIERGVASMASARTSQARAASAIARSSSICGIRNNIASPLAKCASTCDRV